VKRREQRQEQYEFFWLGTDFYDEERTKKLKALLGSSAILDVLCLFAWAVPKRPSGWLRGMNERDIEIACEWEGEPDTLVPALLESGFIEKRVDGYHILQWDRHFDPGAIKRPPRAQFEWRREQRRLRRRG
jgi:hypothetical protein